jgi:predicted aldo/keto reductase-like oxidoreductase
MSPTTSTIRNFNPKMSYRRFGRTEQALSVITLGGMRFVDGWGEPRQEPTDRMLEHCAKVTKSALEHGINHIETAWGYGKSEHCYGMVLNDILNVPRGRYHLMTKGNPTTAAEARERVEAQLTGLKVDHIDLYGWHGVNTPEHVDIISDPNGPVAELKKMQDEGMIGNLGFSTHGSMEVMSRAVETDLFDFFNVHYYYFLQRNWPAIALAAARDMGVFIISPNDKGGQLFNAPPLLRELTAPLTPIQWNARFCLQTPHVHTLSFGMTEPEHFEEMTGIFPASIPMSPTDRAILNKLDARLSVDPISAYEGYDQWPNTANVNVPEILRFRRMWKCYDMEHFGFYRYNMLSAKGHWFPGRFADEEALAELDTSTVPDGIDLKALLKETHDKFFQPKEDGK